MSAIAHPLTYDDLLTTPDDGNRYEIINGVLIVSPSPLRNHQRIVYLLTQLVGDFVDGHGLGEVYSGPVDVRLGTYTVLVPDLLFIRTERLHIFGERLVDGPPDLVIEVASPSTRERDNVEKLAAFAEAGVPEYWLPDPETRTFRMVVLRKGAYQDVEPVDGRYHSSVIAGLIVDPIALFAGLDRQKQRPRMTPEIDDR